MLSYDIIIYVTLVSHSPGRNFPDTHTRLPKRRDFIMTTCLERRPVVYFEYEECEEHKLKPQSSGNIIVPPKPPRVASAFDGDDEWGIDSWVYRIRRLMRTYSDMSLEDVYQDCWEHLYEYCPEHLHNYAAESLSQAWDFCNDMF